MAYSKNPGIYEIEILAKADNINFKSNQEYVVVDDFDIESQFLYQNQNSISKFKTKKHNNYFDFEDLNSNMDKIKIKGGANLFGSINIFLKAI